MKLRKICAMLTLVLSLATVFPVYGASDPAIETRSTDCIEYYYRFYNGVLQFRRWNATKGYWIDATWLNVW